MSLVRLRRFARATNLLVPSRRVMCDDPALGELLVRFGARLVDANPDIVFAGEPRDGALSVLPDGQVVNADGHAVRGPGEPGRLDWARAHMPVTSAGVEDIAHLLSGARVGMSLVLEPKTAVLALELARAGAEVSVFGHAEEVRVEVADELRAHGLAVFADPDPEKEPALAREFIHSGIDWLLDDGAHLIRLAAEEGVALKGAAEETTSGIRRLQAMELAIPVIASNDARSKTLFDNAYGTGQSCLFTILDLLDPDERGWVPREVAVAGYGDVGWGFARLARALGSEVTVAEIDPVRELQARMDGFRTAPLTDLARTADLVVSATGYEHTIDLDVLRAMKEGAAAAVAGGVRHEISVDAALAAGATLTPVSRKVERMQVPGGAEVLLCDRGECINVTAGEGNPIEIMDLSFGVQTAALGHLLESSLPPGLQPLPKHLDDLVAARALEHM